MYGHLVTVKVGVVGRTNQRVQLNGFTFDEYRFKGLDTQAVQCWRTVQQYGVLANHFSENIPHFRWLAFNHLLGCFNGGSETTGLQFAKDKGLEQFQRHFLGQTTLVQAQGGANNNDRTSGVINTLTQQVLTEAALLAFDHVGQRLQGTLVGTGDSAAASAVIQQRVDRFLQHTLFVAHNDIRRIQVQQTLQTIIAVDHPAVEIVQVGGGKTAAIQRYQWT